MSSESFGNKRICAWHGTVRQGKISKLLHCCSGTQHGISTPYNPKHDFHAHLKNFDKNLLASAFSHILFSFRLLRRSLAVRIRCGRINYLPRHGLCDVICRNRIGFNFLQKRFPCLKQCRWTSWSAGANTNT